jgi:hypothetical protein
VGIYIYQFCSSKTILLEKEPQKPPLVIRSATSKIRAEIQATSLRRPQSLIREERGNNERCPVGGVCMKRHEVRAVHMQ